MKAQVNLDELGGGGVSVKHYTGTENSNNECSPGQTFDKEAIMIYAVAKKGNYRDVYFYNYDTGDEYFFYGQNGSTAEDSSFLATVKSQGWLLSADRKSFKFHGSGVTSSSTVDIYVVFDIEEAQ